LSRAGWWSTVEKATQESPNHLEAIMATHAAVSHPHETAPIAHSRAFELLAPAGRVLFGLIFLLSSIGHFSAQTIDFAAAQGVPGANVLVPLSGVLALLGSLSVMLGYKTRYGATLLVLFLVPVTLMMHDFWTIADPMMRQMERVSFLKNMSMLGGALLLGYWGAGPVSIDAHGEQHA
jgi:putative oxidoreductase